MRWDLKDAKFNDALNKKINHGWRIEQWQVKVVYCEQITSFVNISHLKHKKTAYYDDQDWKMQNSKQFKEN